jgi:hypothetical protein
MSYRPFPRPHGPAIPRDVVVACANESGVNDWLQVAVKF